jgi:hypothetical protein
MGAALASFRALTLQGAFHRQRDARGGIIDCHHILISIIATRARQVGIGGVTHLI